MMASTTREQVEAAMIRAAIEAGCTNLESADIFIRKTFPGVPDSVVFGLAFDIEMAADAAEAEAWWNQVEKTIDGEVIRRAIGGAAA